LFSNSGENTLPMNKMTVKLRAIVNEIFNKIQQHKEKKYDGYDSANVLGTGWPMSESRFVFMYR